MFAVFNFALVVFVWVFIKETKGKSLEEMEQGMFPLIQLAPEAEGLGDGATRRECPKADFALQCLLADSRVTGMVNLTASTLRMARPVIVYIDLYLTLP